MEALCLCTAQRCAAAYARFVRRHALIGLRISLALCSAIPLLTVSACRERESQVKPAVTANNTQPQPPPAEPTPPPGAPTPPPGPTKPLAEWLSLTVSDTAFGPITIGMTPARANAAVGGALELPQGMTDDACDFARPRGVGSLTFMIETGKIVRVDVRRHDVQTAEGARVGDTEARIQQLYPGRVRVSPHKYTDGHYLTVVPPDTSAHRYRLIFETDGAIVTEFRGGALPQVEYVEGCS